MYDFVIIGAGIAGASSAARLSELGTVLLLEQEDAPAWHASGRSAALFEAQYGKPEVIALNEASYDYHRDAHGGVLSPRGLMMLAGADDDSSFEADCARMKIPEISLTEARALLPLLSAQTRRVAYSPNAQDIDTDKLIQDFLRSMRRNGGETRLRARVTGLTKTDAGWEITTQSETILARNVVNAAGAWADEIAKLAGIAPVGLTPYRRSMARVPAPEGVDVSGWPMVFGPDESWYSKPDAGALIISPADEDATTPHDAYAEDMMLAEGIARFQDFVDYEVTRMISNWAGLRTFAPDRLLVIGPDPTQPTFLWCAGQGGYGMQSSPAYSQLLADLVAGRTPELAASVVASLSPARF